MFILKFVRFVLGYVLFTATGAFPNGLSTFAPNTISRFGI